MAVTSSDVASGRIQVGNQSPQILGGSQLIGLVGADDSQKICSSHTAAEDSNCHCGAPVLSISGKKRLASVACDAASPKAQLASRRVTMTAVRTARTLVS